MRQHGFWKTHSASSHDDYTIAFCQTKKKWTLHISLHLSQFTIFFTFNQCLIKGAVIIDLHTNSLFHENQLIYIAKVNQNGYGVLYIFTFNHLVSTHWFVSSCCTFFWVILWYMYSLISSKGVEWECDNFYQFLLNKMWKIM